MEKLKAELACVGILPVFCPNDEAQFETFYKAISATEISAVEITLRSDYALTAIGELKRRQPSWLVGAGTILTDEKALDALDAGADFLVSPGYDPAFVELVTKTGKFYLPGCSTPSEIQAAAKHGCTLLKFFPAMISGGSAALKLYAGAFDSVSFLPTGGITLENFTSLLALSNVVGCGGSFMIHKTMLAASDADSIANTIRNCISSYREVKYNENHGIR